VDKVVIVDFLKKNNNMNIDNHYSHLLDKDEFKNCYFNRIQIAVQKIV
jgi:hypothetical protein